MIICLICFMLAFIIYGCYMIDQGIQLKEQNDQIKNALLDLQQRLDLHKF